MGMLGTSSPAGLADRADAALTRLDAVMGLVLEALDTNIEQLCITDNADHPGLQKDFPVKGAQRWILERLANGGELLVPATIAAAVTVLPDNPNRLGATFTNSGENPIILCLGKVNDVTARKGGIAQIWLSGKGGSWDGRLGNMLWSGNVTAFSESGNNTLRIVEI